MPSRRHAPLLLALLLAGACASTGNDDKLVLHHIEWQGVKKVDEGDLQDHIALSPTSWVPLSEKHYVDPLTLPGDKARIEAYYHAHGYFNARVVEMRVDKTGAHDANVVIRVDEGPPVVVRKFEVVGWELAGISPKEAARITRKLPLRVGMIYDEQKYLASKFTIEARLKSKGRAWVATKGEAQVDRDHGTVDVRIAVDPGPIVHIGDIQVVGDPSVSAHAIARRIPLRPGDRYDADLIELARGRIYNLGLFGTVKIEVVPHPGRVDVGDIRVTVSPGKKNDLRLGVGLGLEPQRQEIHFPIRYTRRNFFGGLRTLDIRLVPAWVWVPTFASPTRDGPGVTFDTTLTQPDFLKRNLQARTTVGYDLGVDYGFNFTGPRYELGFDHTWFRDRLHIGVSYDFQYLKFYDVDPQFYKDPSIAKRFYGYTNPYRLGYVQEQATLDLRDNAQWPTFGAYFAFTAEEGSSVVGGGFDYQRVVPDVRAYLPVFTDRIVLAGRVEWGQMFTAGGDTTPITRRLYLGGPDSHRGFGYNRLAPQVPSGTPGIPPVPIGGTEMFLSQTELRIEMMRLSGSWLALGLFWDAGDVPVSGHHINFGDLHHALGGGLRYNSVIGVIRADLGIRINRTSAMESDGTPNPDPGSRFTFHLSLGEAF